MSNTQKLSLFLAVYNFWRRGGCDEIPSSHTPAKIGAALDEAVDLLEKYDELERENAALRHSEENLAATVRGLEFELEKAQKTAAMLRGTVEALGDANDRLTIEITALRDAKRVAEEVCGEVFAKCFADYAAQTLLKQNQP